MYLMWLFDTQNARCVSKKHLLDPGSQKQVEYLNLVLRRMVQGIHWECDPKHARMLLTDSGMQARRGKYTPPPRPSPPP